MTIGGEPWRVIETRSCRTIQIKLLIPEAGVSLFLLEESLYGNTNCGTGLELVAEGRYRQPYRVVSVSTASMISMVYRNSISVLMSPGSTRTKPYIPIGG